MENNKNTDQMELNVENTDTRRQRGVRVAADLAKCAIFVVLMIVGAKISIPFYPVALTFQTVVAVLAGLLLGAKYGACAMAVYVFMGVMGIPVFANGGGFAYVVQVSFGYTLGFIAAAFVAGLIAGKNKNKLSLLRCVIAAVAGFLVNYAVGIPYFACIWVFYLQNDGLWQVLLTGNLLYMPKDFVLCLLAAFLAWRVVPLIHRAERK